MYMYYMKVNRYKCTNTIIHTIFYTFKKSKHEGLVTVSP